MKFTSGANPFQGLETHFEINSWILWWAREGRHCRRLWTTLQTQGLIYTHEVSKFHTCSEVNSEINSIKIYSFSCLSNMKVLLTNELVWWDFQVEWDRTPADTSTDILVRCVALMESPALETGTHPECGQMARTMIHSGFSTPSSLVSWSWRWLRWRVHRQSKTTYIHLLHARTSFPFPVETKNYCEIGKIKMGWHCRKTYALINLLFMVSLLNCTLVHPFLLVIWFYISATPETI